MQTLFKGMEQNALILEISPVIETPGTQLCKHVPIPTEPAHQARSYWSSLHSSWIYSSIYIHPFIASTSDWLRLKESQVLLDPVLSFIAHCHWYNSGHNTGVSPSPNSWKLRSDGGLLSRRFTKFPFWLSTLCSCSTGLVAFVSDSAWWAACCCKEAPSLVTRPMFCYTRNSGYSSCPQTPEKWDTFSSCTSTMYLLCVFFLFVCFSGPLE